MVKKTFKMSNNKKWFKKMTAIEDECNGCISVGGLFMKQTIGINDFVKRQTQHSQFTNYTCSWNDLINRTKERYFGQHFSLGYRDGVIIVHMDENESRLFFTYTDFPMFEGMKLNIEFAKTAGREHEPAQLQIEIKEPKVKCKYVDVILYRHDVLEEDGDASTDCNWEIVSINGRLKEETPPMDPMTIVRNWKHLHGGTEMKNAKAEDVLEMLCKSIMHRHGIKKV